MASPSAWKNCTQVAPWKPDSQMGISHTIVLLSGMLILSLLFKPVAERLRLPFAAVLIITGFVGSEILVLLAVDTGIDYRSFHDLIFYVFLPLLVFQAAFTIDAKMLWKNILVILFLAIPIMLLSTFASAILIYYGIGYPEAFPWIAALLTGALLSATDVSAITSIFPRLGVPQRLGILMEGESLFNDATAIVTFSIFTYIALHPMEDIALSDILTRFGIVFFGGLLIGLLVGLVFLLFSRLFEDSVQQALITLISAYLSYLIAEQFLHVSGVMSVLVTGLIMGRVIHSDFQDERGTFVDRFWQFNIYVAGALVFLLMGVTISLDMFEQRWLAIIIGIAAVLLARAAGIFGMTPLLCKLLPIAPISRPFQRVMFLGGLRGAVTLALALSIPVELEYWWTIQSIAFGVVIFTLFVQAPLIEPLVKKGELTD